MSDVFTGMGSAAVAGGSSLIGSLINYGAVKDTNDQNEALTREAWARDDNATQRRVADLRAAGLAPQLAAGSAAGVSSPIEARAPQLTGNSGAVAVQARQQAIQTQKQIDMADAEIRYKDSLTDFNNKWKPKQAQSQIDRNSALNQLTNTQDRQLVESFQRRMDNLDATTGVARQQVKNMGQQLLTDIARESLLRAQTGYTDANRNSLELQMKYFNDTYINRLTQMHLDKEQQIIAYTIASNELQKAIAEGRWNYQGSGRSDYQDFMRVINDITKSVENAFDIVNPFSSAGDYNPSGSTGGNNNHSNSTGSGLWLPGSGGGFRAPNFSR